MAYDLATIFQHANRGYVLTPNRLPERLRGKKSFAISEVYELLDLVVTYFKSEMYVERVTHSCGQSIDQGRQYRTSTVFLSFFPDRSPSRYFSLLKLMRATQNTEPVKLSITQSSRRQLARFRAEVSPKNLLNCWFFKICKMRAILVKNEISP